MLTENIEADTVVIFLDRLVNKRDSIMPHKCEKILSQFTKKQVYETYVAGFAHIYTSETCAFLPYFRSVGKK